MGAFKGFLMNSKDYYLLIESFLNGKLTPVQFEKKFYDIYKKDELMDENLTQILHPFFEDLDCYDSSVTPETADVMNITEATLRVKAAETLEKLKSYLNKNRH